MGQPNVKSCLRWSIGSTNGSIIGQRTRTNPRDCEKRKCDASNQQAMLSAFFQHLVPSAVTFNRKGTDSVQRSTVPLYRTDSRCGMRSLGSSKLHKHHSQSTSFCFFALLYFLTQ